MKRHLWVIEIFTEQGWNAFIADNTIWHTRSDIRKVLKDYKNRWPSMRFRLRKYIPEDNIGNYIVPTGRKK